MAIRPVFTPVLSGKQHVATIYVTFEWFSGLTKAQKQKSIHSLHESANEYHDISPVLEISSKSTVRAGVMLSAFNLTLKIDNKPFPVENVFQSSKYFSKGGPYGDLLKKIPHEAKQDRRLVESGELVGFSCQDGYWPLTPKTIFYDWIYINALWQNRELSTELLKYSGFTDIEFNPNRSINCQAYSAALFVSLQQRNFIKQALSSPVNFLNAVKYTSIASPPQGELFV